MWEYQKISYGNDSFGLTSLKVAHHRRLCARKQIGATSQTFRAIRRTSNFTVNIETLKVRITTKKRLTASCFTSNHSARRHLRRFHQTSAVTRETAKGTRHVCKRRGTKAPIITAGWPRLAAPLGTKRLIRARTLSPAMWLRSSAHVPQHTYNACVQ